MPLEEGVILRPRRRGKRLRQFFLMLLLFIVLIFGSAFWLLFLKPSTEQVKPYGGASQVIVYQGSPMEASSYLLESGQVLLSFDFLKEVIDPYLYWDEPTNSVIVTTKDKVLRLPSGQVTAFLNKQPIDLQVPVKEVDGVRYIPLAPIEKLYDFQFALLEESGVLSIEKEGYAVQQAQVIAEDGAKVRIGASHREPFVAQLAAGETVDLLGEENGWYSVFTQNGIAGYLPKDDVEITQVRQVKLEADQASSEPQAAGWKPLGEKINMVWEHVVSRNPNTAEIGALPGVNVVSPTWFEMTDAEGTLLNKADPAYVTWAHQRGYKVWGLVTNGFNPDWTTAVLSSYEKREKLASQLLHYAHMYDLDGINIDFENVYLEDKERLVQFVRELTPYLHEQGLTVSIDVTIKSTAETWSMFLDRKALAEVVDYVAVMTYDEHWASSPKAGSVASLPWVENGLQGVLEEVPADKLLLGVPFYTRLWTETPQADGSVKVRSRALSMAGAQNWIKERNLTPVLDEASGQHYVEYKDPNDGNTYKMWLEDATSMEKRIQLVEKYNLAGVAAWRRGFELPEIWTTIEAGLAGK